MGMIWTGKPTLGSYGQLLLEPTVLLLQQDGGDNRHGLLLQEGGDKEEGGEKRDEGMRQISIDQFPWDFLVLSLFVVRL